MTRHPSPYRLQGMTTDEIVKVNRQCLVSFSIGKYRDEVLCDVAPMEVGHVLLGRPWQFDRCTVHDGLTNKYSFLMSKKRIVLVPLSPHEVFCERKFLRQEFEKRHKGKAKEPHECSEREMSATPSSSGEEKEGTEYNLRVPEVKSEIEKKEGKSVSQVREWSSDPMVSNYFVGKRGARGKDTHSEHSVLLLTHNNPSYSLMTDPFLQFVSTSFEQEYFEALPAKPPDGQIEFTRCIIGTTWRGENPRKLETSLENARFSKNRPSHFPSLLHLFPVSNFLFVNFVSDNLSLFKINSNCPFSSASLPQLLCAQDLTDNFSRNAEATSTQYLNEGARLKSKERTEMCTHGIKFNHLRRGSHDGA